jgi:hypothetical protein
MMNWKGCGRKPKPPNLNNIQAFPWSGDGCRSEIRTLDPHNKIKTR